MTHDIENDTHLSFMHMEQELSSARMERYITHAQGDHTKSLELYRLNCLLSERLYVAIQMLEITLRNQIDALLSQTYGSNWLEQKNLILKPTQHTKLERSKSDLRRKKHHFNKGHLIAELTLGFWTSFFDKKYENLWQQTLHHIAKQPNGNGYPRQYFSTRLNDIRDLRNRVAHHEPIYHLPLARLYDDITNIIGHMAPAAYKWVQAHSTFMDILIQYQSYLDETENT